MGIASSTSKQARDDTISLRPKEASLESPLGPFFIYAPPVAPALLGNLRFEAWTEFPRLAALAADDTERLLRQDLVAHAEVSRLLHSLSVYLSENTLFNDMAIDDSVPHVADIILCVLRGIEPTFPPKECWDSVVLPRVSVPRPQAMSAITLVRGDTADKCFLPNMCINSYYASQCLFRMQSSEGVPKERSVDDVYRRYQAIMDMKIDPENEELCSGRDAILATITKALVTSSGVAVLWTYHGAVAFQVGNTKPCGSAAITIRVSGVHSRRGRVNSLHALLAATRVSVFSSRCCRRAMMRLLKDIYLQGSPALVTTGLEDSILESVYAQIRESGRSGPQNSWVSNEAKEIFTKTSGKRSEQISCDDVFTYLTTKYRRVMYARASCAVLLLGSLGGLKVVTKYPNYPRDNGVEHLQDETRTYLRILDTCPELLGDVLPRVLAIRSHPARELGLVMQYFGELITMNDGKYYVGSTPKALREEEVGEIIESGNSALQKLAAAGVYQQDQSLENMRVEKVKGSQGQSRWKVWIIDLGVVAECQRSINKWKLRKLYDQETEVLSGIHIKD